MMISYLSANQGLIGNSLPNKSGQRQFMADFREHLPTLGHERESVGGIHPSTKTNFTLKGLS